MKYYKKINESFNSLLGIKEDIDLELVSDEEVKKDTLERAREYFFPLRPAGVWGKEFMILPDGTQLSSMTTEEAPNIDGPQYDASGEEKYNHIVDYFNSLFKDFMDVTESVAVVSVSGLNERYPFLIYLNSKRINDKQYDIIKMNVEHRAKQYTDNNLYFRIYKPNKEFINLTRKPGEDTKAFADKIINMIKNFYGTGSLKEDIDHREVYKSLTFSDTPKLGPIFISKDGKFVNVNPEGAHSEIFGKEDYSGDDYYTLHDAFGLIKANSGNKIEPYAYIDLWVVPNPAQKVAIIDWMYFLIDNGVNSIQINTSDSNTTHSLESNLPEDIYDTVVRSLNEKLNESYGKYLLENDSITVYRGEEYSRINRFDNDNLYDDLGYSGIFFSADSRDVMQYGIPQAFSISKEAKLYEGSSSRDFCIDNNLLNEHDDILYKISDGHTLEEIKVLYDKKLLDDMNSLIGAYQYMAKKHLSKKGYDGAHWEYEDDLTPEQYQIWNPKVIKYMGEADLDEDLEPYSSDNLPDDLIEFAKEEFTSVGDTMTHIAIAGGDFILLPDGDFIEPYNSDKKYESIENTNFDWMLVEMGIIDKPEGEAGGAFCRLTGSIAVYPGDEGYASGEVILNQKSPNTKQYNSLYSFLYFVMVESNNSVDIVLPGSKKKVTYAAKTNPQQIIADIKNFYSTGVLNNPTDING